MLYIIVNKEKGDTKSFNQSNQKVKMYALVV